MKILLSFLLVLIITNSCQNSKLFQKKNSDFTKEYLQELNRNDMDELQVSFIFMIHCTESYLRSTFNFHSISEDSVRVCEFNQSAAMNCKTQSKDFCLNGLKQFEKEIISSVKEDCSITRDTAIQVRIVHRNEEKERIFYFQKNLDGLSIMSKLIRD